MLIKAELERTNVVLVNSTPLIDNTAIMNIDKTISATNEKPAVNMKVFKTRFSHEVDIAIRNRFFSSYVFRTDYLALVGIDITKPATYTYKTKNDTIDYVQNFIPHAESFYPTIDDIKISKPITKSC